jgi:hypothetical protein
MMIGVVISLIDVYQNYTIVENFSHQSISSGYEGYSLFVRWIAINGDTLGNAIFFNIWPIIAALPFAWSYVVEKETGYTAQICSRIKRRYYLIAKYIAVFASGGTAVSAPLLLNLLINALVCPIALPRVTSMLTPILNRSFLPELFYTRPWLYSLLWCAIPFFYGGATACICLIFGTFIRKSALLILMPFALLMLFDYIYSIIISGFAIELEFSPLRLICPATYSWNPAWAVVLVFASLLILTFALFYMFGERNELG